MTTSQTPGSPSSAVGERAYAPLTGRTHDLKTDAPVFAELQAGRKLFEIRKDDRGYQCGDLLRLRETRCTGAEMAAGQPLIYTGQEEVRRVIGILRGPRYGLSDGWVIMSVAAISAPAAEQKDAPGKLPYGEYRDDMSLTDRLNLAITNLLPVRATFDQGSPYSRVCSLARGAMWDAVKELERLAAPAAQAAEQQAGAELGEPVGVTFLCAGKNLDKTQCNFMRTDVPEGTKLYTADALRAKAGLLVLIEQFGNARFMSCDKTMSHESRQGFAALAVEKLEAIRALLALQGAKLAEPSDALDRLTLASWVAERWHAEVANRPLVNVNRRPLDDAWRQMLRHLGVDDEARLGPRHDELVMDNPQLFRDAAKLADAQAQKGGA